MIAHGLTITATASNGRPRAKKWHNKPGMQIGCAVSIYRLRFLSTVSDLSVAQPGGTYAMVVLIAVFPVPKVLANSTQ
jgi:hypothetical protein